METLKWFILTTSFFALMSCSTNYTPSLDDSPTFDGSPRGEASENGSTDNSEVNADIKDSINGGVKNITADEMPKDEAENDSAVSDSTKTKNTKTFDV